jgi:hypothetical protein
MSPPSRWSEGRTFLSASSTFSFMINLLRRQ